MNVYIVESWRAYEGTHEVTVHETPDSVLKHYKDEYHTKEFKLDVGQYISFKSKRTTEEGIVISHTEVYK